ncbi:MAG: hypothetical protein QF645_04250, partial [Planctomycetota bacterium]|nr:hypothetical protein [Planctomycetota bacterium]
RWVTQRKRKKEAPLRDFYLPFLGTLISYAFFWLPGVILNYYYIQQADLERVRTGQEPPGRILLVIMIWVFLWLPLISIGTLLAFSILMTIATHSHF